MAKSLAEQKTIAAPSVAPDWLTVQLDALRAEVTRRLPPAVCAEHESARQNLVSTLCAHYGFSFDQAIAEVLQREERAKIVALVAEERPTREAKDPGAPLTPEQAADRLGISLTTFKNSGAEKDIPSRQVGKGTKRIHRVYEPKDVDQWGREHKVGGKFGVQTVAKPISSGFVTTGNASNEALGNQILIRLRAKQRGSTRT